MARQFESLSDAELDAAYDAYAKAGPAGQAGAAALADEIGIRLASVTGFIGGLFGGSRFPLYEARTRYTQAGAARSSVADNAANVGTTITKGIGAGLGNILGPILPVLVVAAFIVYTVKKK